MGCCDEPVSMNGNSKPRGCAGAVWGNGAGSARYCSGNDNSGANAYPWWMACCSWDASTSICMANPVTCPDETPEDASSEDETPPNDAAIMLEEEVEIPPNRCGPKFQDLVCDCFGDYLWVFYCNEWN